MALDPVSTQLVVSRTAAGRGAWVCASEACARNADRTGGATRTLRLHRSALSADAVRDVLERSGVLGPGQVAQTELPAT